MFQNRHFRPPKIRRFGLNGTGKKFADSDANSESVTTLPISPWLIRMLMQFARGPVF